VGSKIAPFKVVVGGDNRVSTPELKCGLIDGLVEAGCEALDIGAVATPVFYYALKKLSAAGGVMVTASHNPAEYNGFKLSFGQKPVGEEDIADIGRLVLSGTTINPNGANGKVIFVPDIIENYITHIKNRAPKPKTRLKAVIDAGNAIAGTIAPNLYRQMGYDVVELYCESDGRFLNRSPNPSLPENLSELSKTVKENRADFGVAFDGDADRAAFVDNKGNALDNDKIIMLIARDLLKNERGTIIYDAKCSMAVAEEITRAGGRAIMARAGHTFSKAAFQREGALFAGEISGHFFFRELGVDDAMFAGLKVGALIADKGQPLACLAQTLPQYLLTPDIRVEYIKDDKKEVLEEIACLLKEYNPNRTDGVRIEFPDGWGMIRASVTEPLFTFRFEAKSPERLEEIAAILIGVLPDNELREKTREKLEMFLEKFP
jgi:phosphomannomutase/phosphoglucomutase